MHSYTKYRSDQSIQYTETSESGGRLNIYRRIKKDLTTESYVANIRSVGVRRVLAGLQVGCLPLTVETGHYTGIPFCQRTCWLCDREEVEDQIHLLIICPAFKDLRLQLFNHVHCNTLTGTYTESQYTILCELTHCHVLCHITAIYIS